MIKTRQMKDPNLNSFFDSRNIIYSLTDEERVQKFDYIEPIKAFARATYTSLYVINYLEQGFEYVSDNPLFLCGNTPQQVLEMGYAFYFKHVPQSDLELLLKINSVGFDFYDKTPISERILHTISYDFHLKNQEGKLILINQKLTPVYLTSTGKIWKAICIISLSSERKAGNIKIHKNGENIVYNYNLTLEKWEDSKKIVLSKREKEILLLSTRGFTINEISEEIFVSPDTVKFHRRKLFEKLDVTNISEAISFSTSNKLI